MFFQIRSNGSVRFGKSGEMYSDSLKNFHLDGEIILPQLPSGASVVIDGARSLYFRDGYQSKPDEILETLAHECVASVGAYLAAQTKRLKSSK